VCFIFTSCRKLHVLLALMQLLIESYCLVRQYDLKRLLSPNYCIPCFYAFYALHCVCKTLRLSVFNKELFDLILTISVVYLLGSL